MDARPLEYEYDNASLVKAYKMLEDCLNTKHITGEQPAAWADTYLHDELKARCGALDRKVEHYNLAMEEIECLNDNDDLDHNVMLNHMIEAMCGVLRTDQYKRTIRSSIAPLREYLDDETVEYFEKNGGLENAHKAQFTVIQEKGKYFQYKPRESHIFLRPFRFFLRHCQRPSARGRSSTAPWAIAHRPMGVDNLSGRNENNGFGIVKTAREIGVSYHEQANGRLGS